MFITFVLIKCSKYGTTKKNKENDQPAAFQGI
jgi:hypothetical protein